MRKFLTLSGITLGAFVCTMLGIMLGFGMFLLFVWCLPALNTLLGYKVLYAWMVASPAIFTFLLAMHLIKRRRKSQFRTLLKEKLTKRKN